MNVSIKRFFYSHIQCLFYCIDNNNESISDITYVSCKHNLGLGHTMSYFSKKNIIHHLHIEPFKIYHIFISFTVYYHQTYNKIITTWNAFCKEVFVFVTHLHETFGYV